MLQTWEHTTWVTGGPRWHMSPDNMAGFLISWPLCHPIPWPAMPCHDTYFSTQTGQPLWTGLISCHSRWCREQGHTVVGSLTAQVPADLPQTLTAHFLYVEWEVCVYRHACMFVTVRAVFLPKKDWVVKIMSEYSVHVLLHWLGDIKGYLIANVGWNITSSYLFECICLCLRMFNYHSVNFCQSMLQKKKKPRSFNKHCSTTAQRTTGNKL